MVLPQGPAGSVLAHALADRGFALRGRRLPRGVATAIGLSLAAHALVGAGLYTMTFKPMALPVQVESPRMRFDTVRLYPDEVQPSATPRTPLRTHTPTQTPWLPTPSSIPIVEALAPVITLDSPPVVATPIAADTPAPPAKVIAEPRWIAMPSGDQLAGAYPRRAQSIGQTGSALLTCTVNAVGTVSACAVVSEAPAGAGFGAAAVRLSRYFRMQPKTEDGQPVDGAQVSIPLKFTLGD